MLYVCASDQLFVYRGIECHNQLIRTSFEGQSVCNWHLFAYCLRTSVLTLDGPASEMVLNMAV